MIDKKDAALINDWRCRKDASVGPLFVRHKRLVTWIALRFQTDPEDLFQEAVARALSFGGDRHADSVKAFGSWFSSIARNIALCEIRDAKCRDRHLRDIAYLLKLRMAPASLVKEAE